MNANSKLVACLVLCSLACLLQTACGVKLRSNSESSNPSVQMDLGAEPKAETQPTLPLLSGDWVDGSNNRITITEASDGTLTVSSVPHGRISGSRVGNQISVGFDAGTHTETAVIANNGGTLTLSWLNGSSWIRTSSADSETQPTQPSLTGDWVDDPKNMITIIEANGTLTVNSEIHGFITGTRSGNQITVGFNAGTFPLTAVIVNNGTTLNWANGSSWKRANFTADCASALADYQMPVEANCKEADLTTHISKSCESAAGDQKTVCEKVETNVCAAVNNIEFCKFFRKGNGKACCNTQEYKDTRACSCFSGAAVAAISATVALGITAFFM